MVIRGDFTQMEPHNHAPGLLYFEMSSIMRVCVCVCVDGVREGCVCARAVYVVFGGGINLYII